MKIVVDWDSCEANGVCEAVAPEIFSLDDDDNLNLTTDTPGPELREKVQRAVTGCPRAAISLQED
jgi:ferredoxin